jgi:hypothetical protein
MLLHGDGTNGAQNNTFLDSSTNNFTITRNGNTTQGSFSPYGSNWSNFFGTANDNALLFTELTLSSDFTIETWIYPTAQSSSGYTITFSASSSAEQIMYYYTDGRIGCYFANGANGVSSTGKLTMNVWSHVAVVRSGSTVKIYVNGVDTGVSISGSSTVTVGTISGYTTGSGYNVYGYLSNVRIGTTAVYTSNFTPPTAPLTAITGTLLLTCQSNRYVDNSTSARAITTLGTPSVQRFNPFGTSTAYSTSVIGGSGYFDGSGDYLTAPDNTALDLSGDFTVEAWVNVDNISAEYCVFHNHTSNTNGIALTVNSGAPRLLSGNGSWSVILDSSITIRPNTWNHIAGTRSGNTYTIWVNGVSGGTASSATTPSYSGGAQIGRLTSGVPIAFLGYMSNLRVVKGTAVYTTTFTPSTTPLTAISGTSLLLYYTNGAIFDNAMMNDLETAGNAQISTSVVKYGTGSLAFDGTGDFLRPPVSPMGNLGGNFTVEFWAYLNDQDAQDFVGTATWANYIGAGKSGWSVSYTSSSVSFSYQNNNSYVIATAFASTTLSTSTWNHVAVVRNNGTIKCYVNGVASATTISSSTNFVSTTYGVWVGAAGDANTYGYELNGYLDDVRITNGYARYTANFTPPTAAFQNFGPT